MQLERASHAHAHSCPAARIGQRQVPPYTRARAEEEHALFRWREEGLAGGRRTRFEKSKGEEEGGEV